jgi:hypothetical protein
MIRDFNSYRAYNLYTAILKTIIMKTRLLAIFTIVLFSGLFSACAEDEVLPTREKKGVAQGLGEDDKGF